VASGNVSIGITQPETLETKRKSLAFVGENGCALGLGDWPKVAIADFVSRS